MGGPLRVRALVLRETPVGEADRILTLLAAEQGRFSASARGARRQNSRLVSATEILSLTDFSLFARGGRFVVDDAERVEAFAPVKADLVRLTCAAHAAELVLDCVREGDPAPEIYRLALRTLHALSRPDRDPKLTVRAFEMRLMGLIGFAPCLEACVVCGEPPPADAPVRFSYGRCGVVCPKDACRRVAGASEPLPAGVLAALRHVLSAPEESVFSFSVDEDVRRALARLSERYVQDRMEKEYGKLALIAAFEEPAAPAKGAPPQDASGPAPAADA